MSALAERRSEAGRCVAKEKATYRKKLDVLLCDDNDGDCCLNCWELHLDRLADKESTHD